MEANIQTSSPVSNQNYDSQPSQPIPVVSGGKNKKTGMIISIVVVVLVLIIAAIYLFASSAGTQNGSYESTLSEADNLPPAGAGTTEEEVVPVTGTSDDVDALQADLDAS